MDPRNGDPRLGMGVFTRVSDWINLYARPRRPVKLSQAFLKQAKPVVTSA